jgi:hypothetical protein
MADQFRDRGRPVRALPVRPDPPAKRHELVDPERAALARLRAAERQALRHRRVGCLPDLADRERAIVQQNEQDGVAGLALADLAQAPAEPAIVGKGAALDLDALDAGARRPAS